MRHTLLLAAIAVCAASPSARAQLFPNQQVYVGFQPKSIAIADMNGDGRLDLVDAGAALGPLAICLHRDDGTFAQQIGENNGPGIPAFALVDVNLDGRLDGIRAWSNGIDIALGDGQGGSASAFYYPGGNLADVAAGDLDGDGDPDAVDVVPATAKLEVRIGAGNGAFGSLKTHAVGATPSGVALGDLDSDGALDAVVSDAGGISALRGDGASGFAAAVAWPAGTQPKDVALADVDLDGALDALVVNDAPGTLSWLRGDNAGGFAAPVAFPTAAGGRSIAMSDLDQNGWPDAAIACQTTTASGQVAVLRGAAGSFLPVQLVAKGGPRTSVAAGDLTCDGIPDLAFEGNAQFAVAQTLTSDGAGGFIESPAVALATGASALYGDPLRPGDFDGDGDVDLLRVNAGGAVELLANDGSGTLASAGIAGGSASEPQVIDFDLDGRLDLVGTNASGVVMLAGSGNGSFAPPVQLWNGVMWIANAAAGDVNADGLPDLAVTHSIFLGSATASYLALAVNNGAGQYVKVTDPLLGGYGFPTSPPPGFGPDRIIVRDVSGDGRADVVVGSWVASSVQLCVATAGGSLAAPGALFSTKGPSGLVVEDLTGDGILDVATCEQNSSYVDARRGLGGGAFAAVVQTVTDYGPRDLAAADFDQDGRDDLAHGATMAEGFATLVGDGALHFEVRRYATEPQSGGLATADFDGDGRSDVATLAPYPSQHVRIHRTGGAHAWTCLGSGKPGGLGATPRLVATGSLEAGTPGSIVLENARTLAPAVLFISNASNPVPFLYGTLVPFPIAAVAPFQTDALGRIELAWSQWPQLQAGEMHWFQYAVADPGALFGVAMSNALKSTQP